jgi:hypothetical protein
LKKTIHHETFLWEFCGELFLLKIKRKFHFTTEIRSTFFGCWPVYRAAKIKYLKRNIIFLKQHKISDRWSTIIPYIKILELWPDHGRWPLEAHNWDFCVVSSSAWNFWTIEYHHALYWNMGLWPDWGVGHGLKCPKTLSSKQSQHWDLSNEPSYVQFKSRELELCLKNRVFMVRVLVKARFLDS